MSCSLVRKCFSAFLLLATVAIACDSDDPTCSASLQEDVNDPDMIMHMQMRVGVASAGLPHEDDQATLNAQPEHKQTSQSLPSQEHNILPKQEVANAQGMAVVARSIARTWQDSTAFPVVQDWARSLPLLQIAIVAVIIGAVLIIRKVVHAAEKKAMKKRSAMLDPSTKLQLLLNALRFNEPSCEDEIKMLPQEPLKKVATYQRSAQVQPQQQQANEYDSGNNTEEEPEAEAVAEPDAEAAVESGAVAIAKHAKKAVTKPRHQIPFEVTDLEKVQAAVDFKVQAISC